MPIKSAKKSLTLISWRNGIASIVLLLIILFVATRHSQAPVRTEHSSGKMIPLEKLSLEQKSKLTNREWKEYLPADAYNILREKGTEVPFTGELLNNHAKGTYVTADCGVPVFRSETKFDSHTGWPSFWAPIENNTLELAADKTLGFERTELVEKTCGSHLGHVFDDGPAPTGKRYCINSVALKFIPD